MSDKLFIYKNTLAKGVREINIKNMCEAKYQITIHSEQIVLMMFGLVEIIKS